mgnify:CR=1 FL=1
MEVGMKIKRYLDENGITQAFISRKTGISNSKLNLALNGNRKLTFEEYELICGALGVQAGFFLKARTPEERDKEKEGKKTLDKGGETDG